MKNFKLRQIIFMALCCDFGLVAKKLISPATNLLTDSLHIPGGVATAFSLMFLAVAAALVGKFGCASIMGAVQGILALALGRVGSMGALAPLGYAVPGIVMDIGFFVLRRLRVEPGLHIILANGMASVSACLIANLIVFRLQGLALLLYALVAAVSGIQFGSLGDFLAKRLRPVLSGQGTGSGECRSAKPGRKRRVLIFLTASLLTAMAAVAAVYLSGRTSVGENSFLLVTEESSHTVSVSELELVRVSGEMVNAKGEIREIDEEGILLRDVLSDTEVTEGVTVTADDAYSAHIAPWELDTDNVYLIETDEGLRLIVFGDDSARRDVKNVVCITVE